MSRHNIRSGSSSRSGSRGVLHDYNERDAITSDSYFVQPVDSVRPRTRTAGSDSVSRHIDHDWTQETSRPRAMTIGTTCRPKQPLSQLHHRRESLPMGGNSAMLGSRSGGSQLIQVQSRNHSSDEEEAEDEASLGAQNEESDSGRKKIITISEKTDSDTSLSDEEENDFGNDLDYPSPPSRAWQEADKAPAFSIDPPQQKNSFKKKKKGFLHKLVQLIHN